MFQGVSPRDFFRSLLGVIPDGAVLVDGDSIVQVGPSRRLENLEIARDARVVDATGKVVLPGLIDSHTRPFPEPQPGWSTFSGSYPLADQRKRPAPWPRSPRALLASVRQWMYEMAACGTTTVEVRSEGQYEVVRRELRTVALLSGDPIHAAGVFSAGPTRAGFDAADFRDMASWASRTRAAYACELVCGSGGLRADEAGRLAATARSAGLQVKLLAPATAPRSIGGVAEKVAALSVGVTQGLDPENIAILGRSASVATLLPGLSYGLHNGYPPGRELIDHDAAVCLASAFGPDACPSLSLPMMMTLACRQMALTAEEAISACTINAAAAMARQETIGSIEPGKQADLAIFSVPDYRLIPYYFGFNLCAMTIRRGKIIYRGATAPPAAPVRPRQD